MKEAISLPHAKILLEGPEDVKGAVVFFLPGISGQALSSRFDPLVAMVAEAGYPIARIHIWEDAKEAEVLTLGAIRATLEEAIQAILGRGYASAIGIGKSFGGGVLLSFHHPMVRKKILWAPAIGIAEAGNMEAVKNQKLGTVPNLLDIKLSEKGVHSDPAAISIIHGTNDSVVPLENSKQIIQAALRGRLAIVQGADHSFKSEADERELLARTKEFLCT